MVYLLLAPWSDGNSTSIHWPLSGYFPLLIALPDTLRKAANYAGDTWHAAAKPLIFAGIPLIGFLGTITAFVGIGSQAFQIPLQSVVGQNVLSTKMAGWKEFNRALESRLSQFETAPLIITDNYYTAAQIEFAGLSKNVFTIDENKAVRDGRITQFHLWQKDAIGLAQTESANIIFVTEDSTLNIEEKTVVIGKMCSLSSTLAWDSTLSFFEGDKKFSVYSGTLVNGNIGRSRASTCPYPARAWLDSPTPNAEFSGQIPINGWAFNQDIGIDKIHILIDGKRIGAATYRQQRLDVADVYSTQTGSDPNSPMLGFSSGVSISDIGLGEHQFEIEIVSNNGEVASYGKRLITVVP